MNTVSLRSAVVVWFSPVDGLATPSGVVLSRNGQMTSSVVAGAADVLKTFLLLIPAIVFVGVIVTGIVVATRALRKSRGE